MPFAAGLRRSLYGRDRQILFELTRGDSLEEILDRHLLAVEEMAESRIITSVLLVSADGKRLSHGAGPSLPRSYREAIDGVEVGPKAGSCGTAAYFARPVYVTDIASDPLWVDYRDLALAHGLRSCWSTPILGPDLSVIGTFAIYHRTPGCPTREELEAIEMISEHVAHAILRARDDGHLEPQRHEPWLRLVSDNADVVDAPPGSLEGLLARVARLEEIADELERQATGPLSRDCREALENVARDSRALADVIRRQAGPLQQSLAR